MRSTSIRNAFNYRELEDSAICIRLVRLLPSRGSRDSLLKAEIDHYSFEQGLPEFAAISYTWGTEPTDRLMILSGTPINIRENFRQMLFEIRHFIETNHPERCFYFWVDGLCINQEDVTERNHQIQLMRKIYSKAAIVLAWLGPDANGGSDAVEYLGSMQRRRLSESHNSIHSGDPFVQNSFTRERSQSVLALFERGFWTRVWVVQELLLARDINILCGSKRVPWQNILDFFDGLQFYRISDRSRFMREAYLVKALNTPACRLAAERRVFQENPARGFPLTTAISRFKYWKCSDFHDKVYGFLGVCSDGHRIPVDYNKSPVDVYNDVLTMVCRSGQLDFDQAMDFAQCLAGCLEITCETFEAIPLRTFSWASPSRELQNTLRIIASYDPAPSLKEASTPARTNAHLNLTDKTSYISDIDEDCVF